MKNADQPVFTQDLNAVMIEFAKEEGIELTLNRKGEISSKFLIGTKGMNLIYPICMLHKQLMVKDITPI